MRGGYDNGENVKYEVSKEIKKILIVAKVNFVLVFLFLFEKGFFILEIYFKLKI
jgi:hypothetical protein